MKPYSFIVLVLLQVLFFCTVGDGFTVPEFINHVPLGHYAGISSPCADLQEARNSAISDIVRQILGSINAVYDHSYINEMSGSPNSPKIRIQDELSRIASGVVLDIEGNIIRSSHSKDSSGEYISFILVKYQESKIKEMRRLSYGSRLVASVLSASGKILRVKVTETNGVAVTLASADISVSKKNHFAKMINFCIWKVPYGSDHSFSIALNPIRICGATSITKLDISQIHNGLKDYILGAKLYFSVKINGFDELGRTVSTSIEF